MNDLINGYKGLMFFYLKLASFVLSLVGQKIR